MEEEIWRDVQGYEGLYQVSNFGRVKSLNGLWVDEKILNPTSDKNGYLYVGFHKNGKVERKYVHRLVAEAFIFNPENKPEVNHIDGHPPNNNVSNLEWATHKENMQHAVKTGLKKTGADHSDAKFTKEQIIYIRSNPDALTGRQLAKKFGVHAMTISDVQLGKHYKKEGGAIRTEHALRKLNTEQRNEIRRLYQTGEYSMKRLGEIFDVHPQTICYIIHEND